MDFSKTPDLPAKNMKTGGVNFLFFLGLPSSSVFPMSVLICFTCISHLNIHGIRWIAWIRSHGLGLHLLIFGMKPTGKPYGLTYQFKDPFGGMKHIRFWGIHMNYLDPHQDANMDLAEWCSVLKLTVRPIGLDDFEPSLWRSLWLTFTVSTPAP